MAKITATGEQLWITYIPLSSVKEDIDRCINLYGENAILSIDHAGDIFISYEREETKEEIDARLRRDTEKMWEIREKELETLRKLTEKYKGEYFNG